MKRSLLLTLVATFALAAPASASEHNQRINEVGLSVEGAQFFELQDPASEPFPNPPYKIGVYGPDGVSVGDVPIDHGVIAGRPTPVLIASQPTVGGQTRDIPLTVTIPTDGQACFENKMEKLACVAWGNVMTKLSGTVAPTDSIATSPPAGKSFSRCPRGPAIADPTPKAANACPDITKPRVTLGTKPQKLGSALSHGVKFTLKSNEKAKAKVQLLRQGRILATSRKSLTAGVSKSFALRPNKATRDALAAARSATFTLKIQVTDVAGNARNVTRNVKLTR